MILLLDVRQITSYTTYLISCLNQTVLDKLVVQILSIDIGQLFFNVLFVFYIGWPGINIGALTGVAPCIILLYILMVKTKYQERTSPENMS